MNAPGQDTRLKSKAAWPGQKDSAETALGLWREHWPATGWPGELRLFPPFQGLLQVTC